MLRREAPTPLILKIKTRTQLQNFQLNLMEISKLSTSIESLFLINQIAVKVALCPLEYFPLNIQLIRAKQAIKTNLKAKFNEIGRIIRQSLLEFRRAPLDFSNVVGRTRWHPGASRILVWSHKSRIPKSYLAIN